MSDITFLSHEGWSGVIEAMKTTSQVIGRGNIVTINNSIPSYAHAATSIMRDIPNVLIIGGYGDFFRSAIKKLKDKSRIIILWCSNLLQSELTGEMEQLKNVIELLNNGDIYGLAFIEEGSYKAMKLAYPRLNFIYLPVVPTPRQKQEKINLGNDIFHVDIFCTPDGRKNIHNQILSYINVGTVHVNYEKAIYSNLVSNFKHVKNHGRLPLDRLDQMSISVDLCSQVSANESFNYIAADHMFFGIPVLSSRFVPSVMECKDKLIHKYLIVEDITSTTEISEKANYLKRNSSLRLELGELCQKGIKKISEERKQILKSVFEEIGK